MNKIFNFDNYEDLRDVYDYALIYKRNKDGAYEIKKLLKIEDLYYGKVFLNEDEIMVGYTIEDAFPPFFTIEDLEKEYYEVLYNNCVAFGWGATNLPDNKVVYCRAKDGAQFTVNTFTKNVEEVCMKKAILTKSELEWMMGLLN